MDVNPFEGYRVRMPVDVRRAGYRFGLVDLDGVVLNVVRGPANGVPLVLLPAQMATWETYAEVMPSLAVRFEVFVLDLRGHGASSWTPGRYDWNTVGEDLARFIEQAVGFPAVVAGSSSGGVLALWLASRYPQLTRSIILEDAPVFSAEWPRFKDRDRFVYQGLVHVVEVLDREPRRLADYLRGQVLPVGEQRSRSVPDWLCDLMQRSLDRYAKAHPGQPAGLPPPWPASLSRLFRALSMFDANFARAFVDGRFYVDFDHEEAVRSATCPITLLHARWARYEQWGLVGAMDGDDAQRFVELAPQTDYRVVTANHVIHRGRTRAAYTDAVLAHAG